MSAQPSAETILAELKSHSRCDDLARFVHERAFAAADEQRLSLSEGLLEAAERAGLSLSDADTPFGNVLGALEKCDRDPGAGGGAALLSALLARGVALNPPAGSQNAAAHVSATLLWIATYTPIDAFGALDAALGETAAPLWKALGDTVRRGSAPLGRAGLLVAAAALGSSSSSAAKEEAAALASTSGDPLVAALLRGAAVSKARAGTAESSAEPAALAGELVPPPHPIWVQTMMALSGVLFIVRAGRLIGRLVLGYRRPAEMHFSLQGITVVSKTELLGHTLRERRTHIPREALLRASREVRYPRLPMYAGLFALTVGSYLGISLFVTGARAGSPELLGIGILLVAIGIALDFVMIHFAGKARGRCRVVLIPRKGRAYALSTADASRADSALFALAAQ